MLTKYINKDIEIINFYLNIFQIMIFVEICGVFFFLQSKCDFYIENQFLFRKLKRELEKSAPAETLQVIQQTVDLNVCGYL